MSRRSQFIIMLMVLGSSLWGANGWAENPPPSDAELKAAVLKAYTAKMQVLDASIDHLFRLQEAVMVAYYQRQRGDAEIKEELSKLVEQMKTLGANTNVTSVSAYCSTFPECNVTLGKMRAAYYTWRSTTLGDCVQQLKTDTYTPKCR